jgi:hypothetical protein
LRASLRRRKGRLAEAHKDAERALEIRRRVFGPKHVRVAEALSEVSDVIFAEGKPDEADKLNREALALLDENNPQPPHAVDDARDGRRD